MTRSVVVDVAECVVSLSRLREKAEIAEELYAQKGEAFRVDQREATYLSAKEALERYTDALELWAGEAVANLSTAPSYVGACIAEELVEVYPPILSICVSLRAYALSNGLPEFTIHRTFLSAVQQAIALGEPDEVSRLRVETNAYGDLYKTRGFDKGVARLASLAVPLPPVLADLPIATRLYIDDIDSFSLASDAGPEIIQDRLKSGRIELLEDEIQLALEQILHVSFHRRDWGGEINDLCTTNVMVNGARVATAFLLKGRGCKARELQIRDCGQNGDQLLRLFDSPAKLFVVQYVGPIADAVVRDVEGKVNERRAEGKDAYYCILDGQDTARLLHAYGKLP